jgi:transposase
MGSGTITPVISNDRLDTLDPEQLRQAVRVLMAEMARKDELIEQQRRESVLKQATIDKLTHEMAVLKRLKFAAQSEAFTTGQKSLLEETIDTDLAAVAKEIEKVELDGKKPPQDKKKPKRQPLPPHLPRREIHHEPEITTCRCGCMMKRIGQDVAEKLDYRPGVFSVERHIRGKWVCRHCETVVQAPVPAHIIDKGIPTTSLLAQVLVAKFLDHLPLYRQEYIFARAGMAISRSTLATWVGECGVQLQPLVDALAAELLKHGVLHADETPVAMLKPGLKKTHRAYIWSYATTSFNPVKAVVYDFTDSRGGKHARRFLGLDDKGNGWKGRLVSDGYKGYAGAHRLGVTEVACGAHARRRFHQLWVHHKSTVGEQALKFYRQLYDIEREVQDLYPHERKAVRQERSRPVADAMHQWLTQQRQAVPDGSATAKAIDYSVCARRYPS